MNDVSLRAATDADYDFVYNVQKTTMWEYVEQVWGWDEDAQQMRFRGRFDPAKNQIVVMEGTDIGVFAAEHRKDDIFLAKIYILPQYQGRGIGTRLIESLLKEASEAGKPVALRVLKVNPARRLYERLGFEAVGEDEAFFMMRYDAMRATPGQEF
ncbi:MAG: GNAT family N-acetyltransferase [Anaerolineae bacterium]|nr:GNAT family N-acetyltransferase [Anaerolineae bacterium]